MVAYSNSMEYNHGLSLRGWGRRSCLYGEMEDYERRFSAKIDGIDYDDKYVFDEIGYNFLPSEISAAFALVQLNKLNENIRKRSNNFNFLSNKFSLSSNFYIPTSYNNVETGWLAFPLIFKNKFTIMISFPKPINRILVTGGSGFIGGTLVRRLLKETSHKVFNLDKLGYASNLDVVNNKFDLNKYQLINIDLANKEDTKNAINLIDPDIVFHLAAESHVDRSILGPQIFLETNIVGTFNLLDSVLPHWESLSSSRKDSFRFIHVSTDEVFGSLGPTGLFSEDSPYNPSSPYSASKAASDHLVKAWFQTYGLPIIITNSSNNFGAWQLPEKLIPLIIMNAVSKKPIPIYGDGKNIRDWIYVEDHIDALIKVALKGRVGDSYCIGGGQEKSNEEIVELICDLLDCRDKSNAPHNRFKVFVNDRPGHDRRYAIDNRKIIKELNWLPRHDFSKALLMTIEWYLSNLDWCKKYI